MSTSQRYGDSGSVPAAGSASKMMIIFRKEFREIFRDRRTLMSVVISPLVITPCLFAIMGLALSKKFEGANMQTYTVGVISTEQAPEIQQALQKSPGLNVIHLTQAEAEKRIKARTLRAALIIPADAETKIAQNTTIPLQILMDSGDETSQSAAGRLQKQIGELGRQTVLKRLKEANLPAGFARPFEVTEKPIAESGGGGMLVLTQMLPYMLIFSIFGGAIYAAFDQVAGEKERGTLETLLVSPASRRDIVLGKFSAVVAVCLLSSILAILGLMIPFVLPIKAYEYLGKGGFHLSAGAMVSVLLVLPPLSVLFAGMLLAVSTFARNQKEAQTYLLSLFPIVTIPALLSIFMGTDAGPAVALIPILNASIIIKQALNGSYNPTFMVIAFAASVGYAALALTFATRLFQKESVLIKA